jgi:cytochrome P450
MHTDTLAPARPAHIPDKLFWDHSLAEFNNQLDDPFIAASRLLDGPPLFYARDAVQGRPGWVIARHALLQEAFMDWESFSSEGGMDLSLMLGVDWNLNPVNIDPPKHTGYRKVLLPMFTPKAVGHMEQAVRDTCDMLIARFEDRGRCEFVGEFAMPFPTYIFLSLMGMPIAMAEQFFAWEQGLLHGATVEGRVTAARSILAYLEGHLVQQKVKPATPLMEAIMGAEIDGKRLNDGEILGMFYTFYVGGLDTVYATISWSMRYIATHPEFQQFLRDNPDKLNKAVDELLRMNSVVSTQRRVTRDMTFHGVEMKQDDLVVMPIFIACRDPAAYPNPHEADLERKTQMLSFATGPHLCLGMHLARREIRIAIETFLEKFANIRIPEGEHYTYHAGPTFNVDTLPLTWDRVG